MIMVFIYYSGRSLKDFITEDRNLQYFNIIESFSYH